MVKKRSASEANVDGHEAAWLAFSSWGSAVDNLAPPTATTDAAHRESMESPVPPPSWPLTEPQSVEPCASHLRVLSLPTHRLNGAMNGIKVDAPAGPEAPPALNNDDDDDEDDDEDLPDDEDIDDIVPAMHRAFTPIIAPRPRRVVSPELIFQSATESLLRNRLTDSAVPEFLELSRRRSFRPIATDRPDVEITSPPLRASNPVVLDARFQYMKRLDLQLDASVAPCQPFQPRAHRLWGRGGGPPTSSSDK